MTKAREGLGALGDRVILGNFFKHDFGADRYGLVYERGFLCSLPPAGGTMWRAWPAWFLPAAGSWASSSTGMNPEPPPYPLTPETAAALFDGRFRLVLDEPVTEPTVPVYQGMEHWQEWERVGN